jgi:hypothetical protein
MRKLVFLLGLFHIACKNPTKQMDIKILNNKKIEIPAVSGLEVYGDKLLMISDNTEGLSICDLSGNLLETIALEPGESSTLLNEKKQKSDYEACTIISKENSDYLLVIGSGSKKEDRNKAKLISLNDFAVKTHSLEGFYEYLRSECEIELADFNIEALASHDNKLYFFNRGTNEIIVVKKSSFFDFLKGDDKQIKFKCYRMEVDQIEGMYAGVSGAVITQDGFVIVTLSAEVTSDWYNDGALAGSSIGCFHLSEMKSNFNVKSKNLTENGRILKSKIESVAIHNIDSHKAKLFLVSDNDGAQSELFEIDLLFQ